MKPDRVARIGVVATLAALVLGVAASPRERSAVAQTLPVLAVATTGSDTNPCTPSAPCRTFDRAYRVARPGQVVEVASGTYPSQTIPLDGSKTSLDDVVLQPAPGGSVTLSGPLNVYGRHVEFRDMRLASGWYARQGAEDVTLANVSMRTFSIGSARSIRILGGQVGPYLATSSGGDPKISKSAEGSTVAPTDILIDGTVFRDITRAPGSGLHIECLQVGSAIGLVIRNSTFANCATQGIFLASWGTSYPLRNITLESNTLGSVPEGYHSIKVNVVAGYAPCESCTIRGNRASKPIAVNVEVPGSSILVTENVMESADLWSPGWCDDGLYGVVWTANVFEHKPTCGSNATLLSS